ncbi:acyl-CoA thioesterase (plasmid) [Nicoliella spurrieriana]|uniref:Acyl-CoA thioesterase n=1 Tax=Nicoliella spurrieriana TaxID=2925830 RepID=A0A976X4S8_9LACO|nr:acyl-CoA thioesterase [Nicoliella spurrieriana]UQS86054.1 acyl-CoA thioesterase [Nicoliella spurrieriana]
MVKPYFHKVQYYETDKMKITSHTNYIRFMEEARSDYLDQIGWAYDQFEVHHIISPVTKVTAEYKRTTTFPDVIKIETTIDKVSKHRLVLNYTMTVNAKLVCKASSEHCFLDSDGKIINLQKQVPKFYERLSELAAIN